MADQVEGLIELPVTSSTSSSERPHERVAAAERQDSAAGVVSIHPGDVLVGFLLSLPGLLIFFRSAFTSGFDKIMGNAGDARLQVYGHEHWVEVLRGRVSWTSPEFFYPTKGVLGYSDTFVLNEVFYLPLRAFGMDEFLAFQWTFVLMCICGFVATFILFRRVLGFAASRSGVLSSVLVFSNSLYVKSGHLQLFSLFWVPVLVLLVWQGMHAAGRRQAIAWSAGAGVFLGLLFFSTYYIAWFTCCAALIYGLVLTALRWPTLRIRGIVAPLRARAAAIATFLVGFGMAMVPFVITYLPILRSSGGRKYEDAMLYAARPLDMINLGGTNYVWGSVMRALLATPRLANNEVSLALTPVLAAGVLTAIAYAAFARRRDRDTFADSAIAFGVTAIALILMPVEFGFGSLWRIPWTVVPGAVGIRAIDRIALIAGPCAVVAIACALRVLDRRRSAEGPSARRFRLAVGVVLAVIALEQLNLGETSQIDRSEEVEFLLEAEAPPPECRSFYVTDTSGAPYYEGTIDAMLISQQFDIPTLNGYSGQFPDGFTFLDPNLPTYVDQVRSWAVTHDVTDGLCSFDRLSHRWTLDAANS